MLRHRNSWLTVVIAIMVSVLLVACAAAPQQAAQPVVADAQDTMQEEAQETAAESGAMAEGSCQAITIADRGGVPAGMYPRQYELAEFEGAAGCTMIFHENPDISDLNAQITNNPALPPVGERLPAEPLVIVPYESIGQYGGTLRALSNATEAGTSDFLSTRHVSFVRYGDDFVTIEPNVAKSWEWNDDFTELTMYLREGHKWSDGAPFTAADVAFWFLFRLKY